MFSKHVQKINVNTITITNINKKYKIPICNTAAHFGTMSWRWRYGRYCFSKYSPLSWTHFWWRTTHFRYTSVNHVSDRDANDDWTALRSSARHSKRLPRRSAFSLGKIAKSIGARSGEYGEWLRRSNPKKSIVISVSCARWAGALSWWKMRFSISTSGRFFWMAWTRSRRRTCEQIKIKLGN